MADQPSTVAATPEKVDAPNEASWNVLEFPGINEKYEFNSNNFAYDDIIESGRHTVKEYHFCKVPLHYPMAVKTFRINPNKDQEPDSDKNIEKLKREAKNFRELSKHPNIIDFYGLCIREEEAMICMELMDMALYDLYLVVHSKGASMPENILGYIAIQVLEALVFCKQKNYIHRDVKPKNILLNKRGEIKLCDFGESRILKDSLASTFVGTIAYWPPERLEAKSQQERSLSSTSTSQGSEASSTSSTPSQHYYDVRHDIWSLGVTLAESAYGRLPFLDSRGKPIKDKGVPERNIIAVQQQILEADIEELVGRCFDQEKYSDKIRDFVRQCLNKLDLRPKYDKLMESPFYKEYDQERIQQLEMIQFIEKYGYGDLELNPLYTEDVNWSRHFNEVDIFTTK